MRVVVVGTGIAGLIAAHRASKHHDVVLVTKSRLSESNTRYAQGGIAVALFPDDSVESHVADTLRAGAGLCDPVAVEVLCAEGPGRVRDLIALGVEFDKRDGELVRGHEAAHSSRRVLHAGGDATGFAIESALLRAVRRRAIEVHEHTFVTDLVVDDGIVRGVDVIAADGAGHRILGDAVVLASGGAGQLFRHTTNPAVATGDGIAAAWRAGAAVSDLEFYQFHPTALALPGNHLVSEAVRGEGAVLRDADGERFMVDVHPDAELAPRDVVARGIAAAMARQGGRPVVLDATGLGADFLRARFPGITTACAERGLDWTVEPVPVTPAAHYAMGGIRTDIDGRTTLPGLFAIGEAACTGVHGANRLASNSLLESLVFAWRAADALDIAGSPLILTTEGDSSFAAAFGTTPVDRDALRDLMWERAGLERDAAGLREAAATLAGWRADDPMPAGREDANLLDLGRLLVHAALRREESRGAHFRTDFPEPRGVWARSAHDARPVAARVEAAA
ncbi:L-aspartate oxidase [Pseudolysinimonas yzui]|uniref:L-aspartate oxidase n=1 Tax=Pseudolysinimonas yzui TaxID=2708254 RepID=A0A8J3M313_9MICO|nr:L-aspartate oxidase [Pseudolysinimonas yzui]GHF26177.1 L-aspartate oxidase [Pseudolysinimonas yzui]